MVKRKKESMEKRKTKPKNFFSTFFSKGKLLCFNSQAECRLLKISTVPIHSVKLVDIFDNKKVKATC